MWDIQQRLALEDLSVGQTWESPGRRVLEQDLLTFAGLSGDFNPLHLDEEYARTTPFPHRIAHGLLILSLGGGLIWETPPVRTIALLGIKAWSFRAPVYLGDTIHTLVRVADKTTGSRGRRGQVTWQAQILNQEHTVVQEGLILTLVEARAASAAQQTPSERP